MRSSVALFLALATSAACAAQSSARPWLDTTRTPQQRAHDLVSQMTLEEKALQSVNAAPAIPRLDVPAYDYWNEGLHGVARSGYATLFPQAIGMAATWDAPLLGSIGTVISTEARAKFNEAVRHNVHSIYFGLTIWSPNINIFRDPRWGRGQETYGEDPYLTATLADRFVRGLQGDDPHVYRVIATPKHFAVHSGPENVRHKFNVDPAPHDLWETYLPAFRKTIVDSKADSIMCAYNAVDGKPACASDLLLQDILRKDWHFNGFVTSDCGAIDDFFWKTAHALWPDAEHASASAVLAGTDTSCGNTYKALSAAVHQGLLQEADLDRALDRLFEARIRLGLFDPAAAVPYNAIPMTEDRSPAHLALSLKTSEEAMVLLKNDGILPLQSARYKTIAVVGPNAASLSALEGNYNAVPRDPKLPVDALRTAFPGARIVYAQGAPYADGVPLPVPSTMLRPTLHSTESGLQASYYAADAANLQNAFQRKPVLTRIDPQIDFDWNSAAPVEGLDQAAFAVRWKGYIVPPRAGNLLFNMRLNNESTAGDAVSVRIDGKDVIPLKGEGQDRRTPHFKVSFADTQPHAIEVSYTHHAPLFGAGVALQWIPPSDVLQAEAVKVAQGADLVIAMIGLSPELEGEEMKIQVPGFAGGDRTNVGLPASQVDLLEKIAAVGKPVVTLLLNGSALAVPFAQQHSNAILEAWYPGEFGGQAIANTLLGKNNPAGRLPVTFYASVDDLPPFSDYSMRNRTYRYYTGTPLYGFGYGLSYTHFTYSNLKLSSTHLHAGQTLTATVDVTNVGKVSGDEVAQLYLLPPATGNSGLSPRLQLEGFQRITLKAGQKQTVTFTLDSRQLSQVDAAGTRAVQPGRYELAVGGAQPDEPRAATPPQRLPFQIDGSQLLPH